MTWESLDTWWWPYLFIIIAGWLATDIWRWLGVLIGNRLADDAPLLIWVRAVATALVAAVIAKLILYPSGALQDFPLALRIGAAIFGFGLFLATGRKPWIGILSAVATLFLGRLLL
ncbi:AzlD domain-containing protein [Pseudohoeflea coraliihabitans]|uniref:AzlD domain-containing protein n=1 Tax=Pseudohoeflea coraliihabitans TaxID=2860393 RepID=A0ABS6WS81_9HYPH|nr:AzlD domain-containing protein [Pseudohoeflea sp. DP4N28-3]MBW3098508.1 AzlD domain-containing protein [Pseudohoeflea sp. DP4N28-3]